MWRGRPGSVAEITTLKGEGLQVVPWHNNIISFQDECICETSWLYSWILSIEQEHLHKWLL